MKSRSWRTRSRSIIRIRIKLRIRKKIRRVKGIRLRKTEERTKTKSKTTKLMKRETKKKIQKLITVYWIMNARQPLPRLCRHTCNSNNNLSVQHHFLVCLVVLILSHEFCCLWIHFISHRLLLPTSPHLDNLISTLILKESRFSVYVLFFQRSRFRLFSSINFI